MHTGNMVKPYNVSCEYNTLYTPEGYEKFCEKVYTSAWEMDGAFGQFLINYNGETVKCEVELPTETFNIFESENSLIGKVSGKQRIKIAPFSAVLIEACL